MWILSLQNGGSLHRLSSSNFSRHLSVWKEYGHSEQELFYLTSPHLSHLHYPDDNATASYKMDVLLQILNTALILTDSRPVHGLDLSYKFPNDAYQDAYRNQDPLLHLEQLHNPFVPDVELYAEDSNAVGKIIALTHDDDLVREVIVLYGLSLKEPLYLLINAYKISEDIEYDLNRLKKEPGIDPTKVAALDAALQPFRNGGVYRHYINNRSAAGLQARHGANTHPFNKTKPTFEEIQRALHVLINTWIDAK
ncbi:hypothetical protein [Paenibacillus albus]|uniref:Uncharacterized protein n=1 Tax=Paenibacillus albus TaxID=2495582 RepID=A0A3Q8X9B8_9BACL|nr:hypothetical protein [Paenibacillus albus]AZN43353.1 hypothetical protein EJC50_29430 [Paenibacillus albus]